MIGALSPTKERILKHLSEYQLFKHYISGFKYVGKAFCSELRADTRPSAVVSEFNNRLIYNDFTTDERYDVFAYIMKKYCLTEFIDCLLLINNDFGLGYNGNKPNTNLVKQDYIFKGDGISSIIYIKSRSWKSRDGKFWLHKYGLDLDTLNRYRVYPISHYWVNGNMYKADELAYAYYYGEVDGISRYKIYQPYGEYKWCSNTTSDVIQGFDQLVENDLLILTKSLKDTMVLSKAGYNACSLQAEGTKLTTKHLDRLKSKTNYKKIVVLYDNDAAGKLYANKIELEYGIPSIFLPEDVKDASEFVESYSYEGLVEYVECNMSL